MRRGLFWVVVQPRSQNRDLGHRALWWYIPCLRSETGGTRILVVMGESSRVGLGFVLFCGYAGGFAVEEGGFLG
jgi:hypothetical protein